MTDPNPNPEPQPETEAETPIDQVIFELLSRSTVPNAPREAVDRPESGAGALFDADSDDAEAHAMIMMVQMVQQAFGWPMSMLTMALQTTASIVDSGALPPEVAAGARQGWLVLSAVHSLRQRAGE